MSGTQPKPKRKWFQVVSYDLLNQEWVVESEHSKREWAEEWRKGYVVETEIREVEE